MSVCCTSVVECRCKGLDVVRVESWIVEVEVEEELMGCFCGIGGGKEGGRTAPNVFGFSWYFCCI
jgi:hypothetical protein